MNSKLMKIRKAFGGRLVVKPLVQNLILETVSIFPPEIIEYIEKKVWFFSSSEDAWAYTFTGDDLKDKHLIFLSDELFIEDRTQIMSTIAHEIGHVILGHKNSIHYKQTQSEIDRQEREADLFAKKHL